MRVSLMLSVWALSACGPITPLLPDAGRGGGTAGGQQAGGQAGGASGGGLSTAGGTSGGVAGGAAGGVGGGVAGGVAGGAAGGAAGGLGAFVWSNLVANPAPSNLTFANSIAARSGEAWVGLDNGKLYRSTGGAFNELTGFVLAGLADLYVSPSGKVYAVTQGRTAAHCLAPDCSMAAAFTTVMSATAASTEVFRGLCGAGERVVAFGVRDSTTGVLYEFDGVGAWAKVSNNLGVSTPQSCAVGPAGEVFVVGDMGVVRYENGATTPESIDLMGQPPATWRALGLVAQGGAVVEAFMVGGGSGYRFARRNHQSATWTSLAPNAPAGSVLNTVLAIRPDEFLAAGTGTTRFMAWNGTAWAPAMPPPPSTISTIRDAWVTDEREVFLVGLDGSSSYTIIRGRR